MTAPLDAPSEPWRAQARCVTTAGVDAGLFFSDELADIALAKTICGGCPALAPCLEGALERQEPCGVWGGQLFDNGRIVMLKRRRGRPPKVARPEDQIPHIEVPEHLRPLARTA
ncbi:MAG: WhiB family transcriptional regulator [Acidimicrobiales bacterium]